MIKNKINAALIIRKFEHICEELGDYGSLLHEALSKSERDALNQPVAKMLAEVLFSIDYPIVKLHPELRPTAMVSEGDDRYQYSVIEYNLETREVPDQGEFHSYAQIPVFSYRI